MAWGMGLLGASAASAIPASILIVDGGKNTTSSTYGWGAQNSCSTSQTATMTFGGGGGNVGIRDITINRGSISVIVGAGGGGASSFNGLAYNAPGNRGVIFPNSGSALSQGSYCACFDYMFGFCTSFWTIFQAGGGGSAGSPSSSGSINGVNALTSSEFNNVVISAGGGGRTTNYPTSGTTVQGTGATSTYGQGQTAGGASANAGVVVIKYPDTHPLPSSGSYSQVTTGGFRYITCTASTTLVWA